MENTQANKENKIINLVKPNTPNVVVPSSLPKIDLNSAPQVAQEANTSIEYPPSFDEMELVTPPSFDEIQNDNSFDSVIAKGNEGKNKNLFHKAYELLDIPEQASREGLNLIVSKIADNVPWPEADDKEVWKNVLINSPRMLADTAAEFTASAISPESLALMGWGKGIKMLSASKAGKQYLKPAIQTAIDYAAGKIPNAWKRPFVYKFGLENKQEYLERASERIKEIKEWSQKASEIGLKLSKDLPIEAQKLSHQLMTNGWSQKELENIAIGKWNRKKLMALGIKSPKEFIGNIIKAREIVDESSDIFIKEALKSGTIDNDLALTIQNNKGKYLPRLYEIFENPGLRDSISKGDITPQEAMGIVEDLPDFLKRVAKFSDDKVAAFMKKPQVERDAFLKTLGRVSQNVGTGKKTLSTFFNFLRKRKDIPEQTREAMKEIKTSAYPTAKAIQEIRRSTANIKFFDDIAQNPNWSVKVKGKGPKDWIYIPEDFATKKKMGPLAGTYVHPAIAEDIRGFYEVQPFVDRMYKNFILPIWKGNKILLNPATHSRNMIANTIMLDLSGTPFHRMPDLMIKVDRAVRGIGKYAKEVIEHDLLGHDFTASEITNLMGESIKDFAPKTNIKEAVVGGMQKVYGKFAHIYGKEEEYFKVAKFIHAREEGMSAKEAAKEAEKWLFNYSKISSATKLMRDNPVYNTPFITYTVKSVPRLVETAFKNPFRIYKYHLIMDSLNQAGINATKATPEEIARIKQKNGIGFIAPSRDEKGNLLWFSMNSIFPWADIKNTLERVGGKKGEISSIQPGGPILSMYEALVFNKNIFTGKEIAPEGSLENRNMKRLAYIYQSFMPETNPAPFFGSPSAGMRTTGRSFQRLTDAAYADDILPQPIADALNSRKEDYFGKSKHLPFAVLDFVFGLRAEPLNPNELKAMDARDFENGIKDVEKIFSSAMKDQGLTIDERQKNIKVEQFRDKIQEVLNQWHDNNDRIQKGSEKFNEAPNR